MIEVPKLDSGFLNSPRHPFIPPIPLARHFPIDQRRVRVALAIYNPKEESHIEGLLNEDGYEVIPFDSAEMLWERFAIYRPRLVITDRNFNREFTGLDLCRKIRGQFPAPYVYVIVLSQLNHAAEIDACLDSGADDYLIKPYSILNIRSRMEVARRWLRRIDGVAANKMAFQTERPVTPQLKMELVQAT